MDISKKLVETHSLTKRRMSGTYFHYLIIPESWSI